MSFNEELERYRQDPKAYSRSITESLRMRFRERDAKLGHSGQATRVPVNDSDDLDQEYLAKLSGFVPAAQPSVAVLPDDAVHVAPAVDLPDEPDADDAATAEYVAKLGGHFVPAAEHVDPAPSKP